MKNKVINGLMLWMMVGALSGVAQTETNRLSSLPFPMGERLLYKVYWGFIPVASAEIKTEWVEHEGKSLAAIKVKNKSNAFISTIYPVEDEMETWLDPDTLLPVRFRKLMNQGKTHRNQETWFDYDSGIAHWKSLRKNTEKEIPITPNIRDMLGYLFWARGFDFKPNTNYVDQVLSDTKIYDVFIHSKGYEKVKLKQFGKIKSLRFEPEASFEGLFVKKGKMTVWISDDQRQLMTKMNVDLPFANVKLFLTEVEGGYDDFWTQDH